MTTKSIDIDLIKKYYGYSLQELGTMSFDEVLFLQQESSSYSKEDERAYKLQNHVPYWKMFFENLSFFLNSGFKEKEIDVILAEFNHYDFYEEKAFQKGQKPYQKIYEFIRSGTASFPVPRTRTNKTETLAADFYHVPSASIRQDGISRKVFLTLIKRRLPFLINYKMDVYDIGENSDVYIPTNTKNSLYVPIKALLTCDSEMITKRMVDYFDKSSNGSYGKSEDVLNTPIAKSFLKDLDSMKKSLNKVS